MMNNDKGQKKDKKKREKKGNKKKKASLETRHFFCSIIPYYDSYI